MIRKLTILLTIILFPKVGYSISWPIMGVKIKSQKILAHRGIDIYDSEVRDIEKVNDELYILGGRGPELALKVTDVLDVIPFLSPSYAPKIFKVNKKLTISIINLKTTRNKKYSGLPLNNIPNKDLKNVSTPIAVNTEYELLKSNKLGVNPIGFSFSNGYFFILESYGPSLLKVSMEGIVKERHFKNSDKSYLSIKSSYFDLPEALFEKDCHFKGISTYQKNSFMLFKKCDDGNITSIILNNKYQLVKKIVLFKLLKGNLSAIKYCQNTFYYSLGGNGKIVLSTSSPYKAVKMETGNVSIYCQGNSFSLAKKNKYLECDKSDKCISNNYFEITECLKGKCGNVL